MYLLTESITPTIVLLLIETEGEKYADKDTAQ